ncbi:MAG: GTP-binding protein [Bacteroides sp. SM23_62_1]|nr:MAG: GTP-binding protein [Bacteroides sp. SM23_62_1]
MKISKTEFICSSKDARNCPESDLPEYAFIGRSNVGKSSLINYLANRNKLARTSSAPGRTRLINHFLINDEWYLVDLPGYGYIRSVKSERPVLKKLISDYILQRTSLTCLFVLLDARLEPQKIDLQFITWLGMNRVSFVLVFTKKDKISSARFSKNKKAYESLLLQSWVNLPPIFMTSVLKKSGREEILDFIDQTNRELRRKG